MFAAIIAVLGTLAGAVLTGTLAHVSQRAQRTRGLDMTTKKTAVRVAPVLVILVLALVGCGHPEGPAGTVTGRHDAHDPGTKAYRYELTTTETFQVHVYDWKACQIGDTYPACTNR